MEKFSGEERWALLSRLVKDPVLRQQLYDGSYFDQFPDPGPANEAPWLIHAERTDFAWSMGGSSDYLPSFAAYLQGLTKDQQADFMRENPEPDGWEGFYDQCLKD